MPDLPVIPYPEEVSEPAVAEKVYGASWVKSVEVRSPQYGIGTIYIETAPMVEGTGEVHPRISHEIRTDQLWAAVAAVPEVAQAMGAILSAIPALEEWLASLQEEND